jgi:cytochrome c oxidase subunit 1
MAVANPPVSDVHAPVEGDNYLTTGSGILSWLFTLDHKRISVMYMLVIVAPGQTIMDADTYNQMFTLHGAVMVFLFIIPGIPAALGNFVLPIMLGAKDVAFRA